MTSTTNPGDEAGARPFDDNAGLQLQALENFVLDNNDLRELENRVGRFNVFDALGVIRTEIRHSNFLAWLLDPSESHGQGTLFLRAVLMDLLWNSDPSQRPFSPVELDGAEMMGVEVRREWNHIDLLITCEAPQLVIAIENKIDSGEHSNQLQRYEDTIATEFANVPKSRRMFVFLTTDGEEASDEDWVSYSYADLHRVLSRVRNNYTMSIGEDVQVFLNHYLSMIGSRFMEDAKIAELCRRIYRNHRQAIDLVMEYAETPKSKFVEATAMALSNDAGRWTVIRKAGNYVEFVAAEWRNLFPPIGVEREDRTLNDVVVIRFVVGDDKIRCMAFVCPTTDAPLRELIVERLIRNPDEFGLRNKKKRSARRWTTIKNKSISGTPEEPSEESLEQVRKLAAQELEEMYKKFSGLPEAIKPIIEEWRLKSR